MVEKHGESTLELSLVAFSIGGLINIPFGPQKENLLPERSDRQPPGLLEEI